MKKLLTVAALVFSMNVMSQDIYIPNAFTPDGDARNDYWKPVFDDTLQVVYYRLTIWARDGLQVFETRDPIQYWDGSYENDSNQSSMFMYDLNVHFYNKKPIHKLGIVEVLK
jgi:gliding motility-associated-like protein